MEPIEGRRHLSTTLYSVSAAMGTPNYSSSGGDVPEISWSASGSDGIVYYTGGGATTAGTITANISGLPAHSMIRLTPNIADEGVPDAGGSDTDKLTVTYAGKTITMTRDANDPYWPRTTGSSGVWVAHSGSTLSVTFADGDGEANDGNWDLGFFVDVYTPTVSISGGSMTDEDDATPTGFTVSRDDVPTDYQGVVYGDEQIPAIDVKLDTPTGTAMSGSDYQTLPTTVTIPAGQSSKLVPLVPIDDPDAEGVENVILPLKTPGATDAYVLAAVPATAPNTNAGAAKVQIDDNVKATSITVTLMSGAAHPAWNTLVGYRFDVKIEIKGEHVDQMAFRQQINSSTTVTKFDNTAANAQDLNRPDFNSVKSNSNGWGIDEGPNGQQEWNAIEITPGTKNGEGIFVDQHKFSLDANAQDYGGQQAFITYLISASRYMKDAVSDARTGKNNVILKTLDWGYKWSNWNLVWKKGDNPAPPEIAPGVTAICACNKKDTGKGIFSDVQTISGLIF